jgi:hypothetical protein
LIAIVPDPIAGAVQNCGLQFLVFVWAHKVLQGPISPDRVNHDHNGRREIFERLYVPVIAQKTSEKISGDLVRVPYFDRLANDFSRSQSHRLF